MTHPRPSAIAAVLLGILAVAAFVVTAPGTATAPAGAAAPAVPLDHGGELDCRACHVDKHRSVAGLGAGTAGRGAPQAPDRMFQLGVQCVACHKEASGDRVTGTTFRASETACATCHGDRYRGMVGGWREGFAKLQQIATAKIAAGRAALATTAPGHAGQARATKLLEDAEHNTRLVKTANGAHNVFYSARLLDVAGRWADDAARAAGGQPATVDDRLARGQYCAVLCHSAPGMKPPRDTVTFRKTPLPHVKHAGELGATCTTCHSAETHKRLVATPATCTSCHHSPQNERCESCHRLQTAFYRGTPPPSTTGAVPPVKLEPNSMAAAVGCTGCHDMSKKHSRTAVGEKCLGCHDKTYESFVTEWTTGIDAEVKKAAEAIAAVEADVAKARRSGRKTTEADVLLKEARETVALVRRARGAHNPSGADALLSAARDKTAAARSALAAR